MNIYNYALTISIDAKNTLTPLDDIHITELKASLEQRIRELDQAEHASAKAHVMLTQI